MKNRWLIFALLIVLGIGFAYYFTQRDYRNDILRKDPEFNLTAGELLDVYNSDESKANDLYLGKVMVVNGEVSSVENDDDKITIKLNTGDIMSEIVCEMNQALYDKNAGVIEEGQSVSLKCECAGKLMDVNLVNCVFNK